MTTELIIIVISIILVYAGTRLKNKNKHLFKVGIRTTANVVSTRFESSRSDGDIDENKGVYYSTIQFSTKKDQPITIEYTIASNKEDAIGAQKKIIYDPQSPEEAQADNHFVLVTLPWLIMGTGIIGILWMILEFNNLTDFIK